MDVKKPHMELEPDESLSYGGTAIYVIASTSIPQREYMQYLRYIHERYGRYILEEHLPFIKSGTYNTLIIMRSNSGVEDECDYIQKNITQFL